MPAASAVAAETRREGDHHRKKRARLEALYRDYLKKLEQIDFKSLSQECKVDYILFKRDLDEHLKLSAIEAAGYAKIKKCSRFPTPSMPWKSCAAAAICPMRKPPQKIGPAFLPSSDS